VPQLKVHFLTFRHSRRKPILNGVMTLVEGKTLNRLFFGPSH
jgi:hypothetical protein